MKINKIVIAVLLMVGATASAQIDRSVQPKPGAPIEVKIKKPYEFKLKNGVSVMVVENHKKPKVSFQLSFDNGPLKEGNKAGIASILSTMLGNGTTSMSKKDFNDEVDFMGASINVNSSGGRASGLLRYSDRILEMFSDALINPVFSQEEFDKVKTQKIERIKSNKKSVNVISSQVGRVLSYGANSVYGEYATAKTIKNITLDNLRAYHLKYFNPNNAYLVVIGDVNPEEIKKDLEKHIGKWEVGLDFSKKSVVTVSPDVQYTQINFVDMESVVQSVITLTNNAPDLRLDHPDYFAVLIANRILGKGLNSYLNLNLREAHGYTYDAGSKISANRFGASRFKVKTSVRNMVTDSSVVQILNEVKRIREVPVTPELLKGAKAKLAGKFIMGLSRPSTVSNYALMIKLNNLKPNYYENYLSNIEKVTAQDVQRVANKYFKLNNARIVIVGKGSDVIPNLEKTKIPIKYFNIYGKAVAKPEFSKKVPKGVTAASIINKHIKLIGGVENLKKVKTIHYMGSMTVSKIPLSLNLDIKKALPNKRTLVATSPQGKTIVKENFNGVSGYKEKQGVKKALSADELENRLNIKTLFPELNYKATDVKLESIVTIDGEDMYKVQVVGTSEVRYYSVKQGLLMRIEKMQNGVKAIAKFDMYSEVKGAKFPYVITMQEGNVYSSMIINNVKVNEGVSKSDFK